MLLKLWCSILGCWFLLTTAFIQTEPARAAAPIKLNGPLVAGGDAFVGGLQFSPDSSRVLYLADQDTDEVFEIYSVPSTGGPSTKLNGPLVAGGDVAFTGFQFSPDGSRVLYYADQDTDNVNEIYIVPAGGGTPVKLNGPLPVGGDVTGFNLQFSPDGSRVLYGADQNVDDVFEIFVRIVRNRVNSGGGDWDLSGNWQEGVVPDEVMQVFHDATGTITATAGSRTVNELVVGGGAGTSTLALAGGATIDAINGMTIEPNGVVQGEGAIFGNVQALGTLSPGTSAGTLGFGGDLTLGSQTELEIELGGLLAGFQFDRLNVASDLSLAGDLLVSLINGFMPTPGEQFEIIEVVGTLSGTFDGLAEGALVEKLGGTNLVVTYTAGDGNDVALVAALPGDFDFDGDVDGHDFLKWQRGESPNPLSQSDLADWEANYGTSNSQLPGDFDLNGEVNGLDFLLWQRDPSVGSLADWEANYGMVAPLSATLATVPEPTTYALALAALCLAMSRRRAF